MATQHIQNVTVRGIASAVPKRILEVRDSKSFPSVEEAEKFIAAVGVERVRRHLGTMCCSDMCQASAEKLMVELDWKPEDIDMLIFLSQSMDYILPATACVLHGKMGLRKDCACFDIGLGCSGWPYGLSVACGMMQSGGFRRVLLLMGDAKDNLSTPEKILEAEAKVIPLFGAAGTATALEYDSPAAPMMIDTCTDGTGYEAIIRREGAGRHPFKEDSLEYVVDEFGQTHRRIDTTMDGAAVFVFGISQVPRAVKGMLQRTGQSVDDVDYFLFHQANLMMNEQIRKKCKIPLEKCPYSLRDFGNNSSASIPLTMVTQIREQLTNGAPHKIIACGFGVGLSWGTVSLTLQNCLIPPLIEME